MLSSLLLRSCNWNTPLPSPGSRPRRSVKAAGQNGLLLMCQILFAGTLLPIVILVCTLECMSMCSSDQAYCTIVRTQRNSTTELGIILVCNPFQFLASYHCYNVQCLQFLQCFMLKHMDMNKQCEIYYNLEYCKRMYQYWHSIIGIAVYSVVYWIMYILCQLQIFFEQGWSNVSNGTLNYVHDNVHTCVNLVTLHTHKHHTAYNAIISLSSRHDYCNKTSTLFMMCQCVIFLNVSHRLPECKLSVS